MGYLVWQSIKIGLFVVIVWLYSVFISALLNPKITEPEAVKNEQGVHVRDPVTGKPKRTEPKSEYVIFGEPFRFAAIMWFMLGALFAGAYFAMSVYFARDRYHIKLDDVRTYGNTPKDEDLDYYGEDDFIEAMEEYKAKQNQQLRQEPLSAQYERRQPVMAPLEM